MGLHAGVFSPSKNKHIGKRRVGQIHKAAAAIAATLIAAPASAAWEPTKPVEIVVAAGAGGASDQMARMMQAAIQKNNLMKQPMVVSLKGGASGAEALIYMKSGAGDPHKVLIAYSLIYMLPLSAKIPFNWRELTPVSVIALDQFVLWDNTTLQYKTKVTDTQSWNDIPTCKDEGIDVQYLMLRAMFLPGKVTPDQTAFYVDLFRKLTQTSEYKDYMEKQALKPVFLTGNDMLKFLEEDDALNKNLMTEAGFVAN